MVIGTGARPSRGSRTDAPTSYTDRPSVRSVYPEHAVYQSDVSLPIKRMQAFNETVGKFTGAAIGALDTVRAVEHAKDLERIKQENEQEAVKGALDATSGKTADASLSNDMDYMDAFESVKGAADGAEVAKKFRDEVFLHLDPKADFQSALQGFMKSENINLPQGPGASGYAKAFLGAFSRDADAMSRQHAENAFKQQIADGELALSKDIQGNIDNIGVKDIVDYFHKSQALNPYQTPQEAQANVLSALIAGAGNSPTRLQRVSSMIDSLKGTIDPETALHIQDALADRYDRGTTAAGQAAWGDLQAELDNASTAEEIAAVDEKRKAIFSQYGGRSTYDAMGHATHTKLDKLKTSMVGSNALEAILSGSYEPGSLDGETINAVKKVASNTPLTQDNAVGYGRMIAKLADSGIQLDDNRMNYFGAALEAPNTLQTEPAVTALVSAAESLGDGGVSRVKAMLKNDAQRAAFDFFYEGTKGGTPVASLVDEYAAKRQQIVTTMQSENWVAITGSSEKTSEKAKLEAAKKVRKYLTYDPEGYFNERSPDASAIMTNHDIMNALKAQLAVRGPGGIDAAAQAVAEQWKKGHGLFPGAGGKLMPSRFSYSYENGVGFGEAINPQTGKTENLMKNAINQMDTVSNTFGVDLHLGEDKRLAGLGYHPLMNEENLMVQLVPGQKILIPKDEYSYDQATKIGGSGGLLVDTDKHGNYIITLPEGAGAMEEALKLRRDFPQNVVVWVDPKMGMYHLAMKPGFMGSEDVLSQRYQEFVKENSPQAKAAKERARKTLERISEHH